LVGKCPGGKLACHTAVTVGLKLLDGLEQMHALGYTHANLHPGNILFTNSDFSKPKICLADFSPNYVYSFDCYDPERDSPLVNSASLPFLVPELIIGTSHREPVWDLYSLGQVLYLLLTGTLSLEIPKNLKSRDWSRLAEALLENEPLSIQEREPKIPTRLAHLIDRAVNKRPQERFNSLAEFRHALQQVLEAL
jgi:eukaryotic-like serine/threonine-protein kinase